MKKRDKYKLINYAIDEYSKKFNYRYERMNISCRSVLKLLDKYKHSTMCEWSYCCYGLYSNCWQEPYFKGNWGMTQKRVDEIIYETVHKLANECRRDSRMACYTDEIGIHMVIVARDLPKYREDYLITFSNKENW